MPSLSLVAKCERLWAKPLGSGMCHSALVKIGQIYVDECVIDSDGEALVVATVFEFGPHPRWVTADPAVAGERVGPMVLPRGAQQVDTQTVGMTSLGARPMQVRNRGDDFEVSYSTVWTVNPSTVYAVVLPHGFVPIEITLDDEHGERLGQWPGVTAEGCLFEYSLFFSKGAIAVKLRAGRDPVRAEALSKE